LGFAGKSSLSCRSAWSSTAFAVDDLHFEHVVDDFTGGSRELFIFEGYAQE
jgi:hypothetical protein